MAGVPTMKNAKLALLVSHGSGKAPADGVLWMKNAVKKLQFLINAP